MINRNGNSVTVCKTPTEILKYFVSPPHDNATVSVYHILTVESILVTNVMI